MNIIELEAELTRLENISEETRNSAPRQFAVLLADDESDSRFLTARSLERSVCLRPVAEVQDGVEAIEYLRGDGKYGDRVRYPFPALLLLDIEMPRITGFEVLRWIQRHPFPDLRVVMLSASLNPENIAKALALGADYYQAKPHDQRSMWTLIRRLEALMLLLHPQETAQVDRLRQDADPSALPGQAGADPGFNQPSDRTSEFGTVLALEQELQSLVRSLTVAPRLRTFAKLKQIFENHVEQIGAVLGLLDERDRLLPAPKRFSGLASAGPPIVNALPLTESRPMVHDLIRRHQTLRRHLGVLISASGNKDGDERHLKDAARRHEEMEWMLTAVLVEDAIADDLSTPDFPRDHATLSQELWENEGGRSFVPRSPR